MRGPASPATQQACSRLVRTRPRPASRQDMAEDQAEAAGGIWLRVLPSCPVPTAALGVFVLPLPGALATLATLASPRAQPVACLPDQCRVGSRLAGLAGRVGSPEALPGQAPPSHARQRASRPALLGVIGTRNKPACWPQPHPALAGRAGRHWGRGHAGLVFERRHSPWHENGSQSRGAFGPSAPRPPPLAAGLRHVDETSTTAHVSAADVRHRSSSRGRAHVTPSPPPAPARAAR